MDRNSYSNRKYVLIENLQEQQELRGRYNMLKAIEYNKGPDSSRLNLYTISHSISFMTSIHHQVDNRAHIYHFAYLPVLNTDNAITYPIAQHISKAIRKIEYFNTHRVDGTRNHREENLDKARQRALTQKTNRPTVPW